MIFIIAIFFTSATAHAKEINFEASVESNLVSVGESVRLELAFHGTQDIPVPDIKDLEGFQVRYVGPSRVMSIVNGKISSSITHNYSLLPLRAGNLTLGPFTFEFKGDRYVSNKIDMKVVEGAHAGTESLAPPQSMPDLQNRIFLTLSTDKASAYINEIIPLKIKLYINRLSVRDIQYPTFAQQGFSKADFDEPKQYRESRGGAVYDVIEFNTRVFGTKTGELKVGPAEIVCNLVVKRSDRRRGPFSGDEFFGGGFDDSFFDDFFAHYERYPVKLASPDATIAIIPLPKEGAPEGFSGSIGDYQFILDISPKEVKAGDPIKLKMSIYGNGNSNALRPPVMDDTGGFKVYEPQSRTEDSHKVFEQVVIPESEDVKEIPKIKFDYFDPKQGIYRTISHGPIPITVEKSPEAAKPRIVALPEYAAKEALKEAFGRDIIYIKESLGPSRRRHTPIYKDKLFLAAQFIPLLFFITAVFLHSRSERLKRDTRYARRIRAPKAARRGLNRARRYLADNKKEEFYDSVFMTLRSYLGDKFHLPTGGITVDVIDEALKPRGFREEELEKLRRLFEECDLVRYAPSGISDAKMRSSIKTLEEVISYFERARL